jgi:glucokinase
METARRFVLPGVGTRTQVRIARSGPQAGVRGAALLAGQELVLGDRPTIQERG